MFFLYVDFVQLMCYGVHIGHSIKNTLAIASSFVFAFRLFLALIDLFATMHALRSSILLLSGAVFYFASIWFVNTNFTGECYAREAALNCGEFYAVSGWINGAISNYFYVYKSWKKFSGIFSTIFFSKYGASKTHFLDKWYLTRFTWPRLVFFSNVNASYVPVKECFSAKLPAIGVVDTNTQFYYASLPIPGNDESVPALIFYNDFFSTFILIRKFSNIALWLFNIRASKRVLDFASWISLKGGNFSGFKKPNFFNSIVFSFNVAQGYSQSIYLISSFSYWFQLSYEKLDLFVHEGIVDDLASKFYFALLVTDMKVLSFINFQFILKHARRGSFFRRKFLTNSNFRLFYLRKKFMLKKVRFKYNFKKKHFSIRKNFFKQFLFSFRKKYLAHNKNLLKNYITWYKLISRYYYGSKHNTSYILRVSFPILIKYIRSFLKNKPHNVQRSRHLFSRRYTKFYKNNRFASRARKWQRRKLPLFKFPHFLFLKIANLFFFLNYHKFILNVPFYFKASVNDLNFLKLLLSKHVNYLATSSTNEVDNFNLVIKSSLIYNKIKPKIFLKLLTSTFLNKNKRSKNLIFLQNKPIKGRTLSFFFSDFYMGKFVGLMSSFWYSDSFFLYKFFLPRYYLLNFSDNIIYNPFFLDLFQKTLFFRFFYFFFSTCRLFFY